MSENLSESLWAWVGDETRFARRGMTGGMEGSFYRALLRLRPPKFTALRCGLTAGLFFGIGTAHHLGGANIGLYTFFVLPCALAAWSIGLAAGMLAAVSGAAIVLASDLATQVDVPRMDLAFNASLRLGLYALVSWGVETIGRLLERLHALSRTDTLTGLANRREFLARGAEEVQRARRTLRPFTLIYLDLDDFKSVNDRFGHAAGDALLNRVGMVLRAQLRSIDVPARLGGDEFAVLLPETDSHGARRAGELLHQKLKQVFVDLKYSVSSSIGAATFLQPPASFDDAVKCADGLMYSVKNGSKDALAQKDFLLPPVERRSA